MLEIGVLEEATNVRAGTSSMTQELSGDPRVGGYQVSNDRNADDP